MPRLSALLKNQVTLVVPYRGTAIGITYKPEAVNADTQNAIHDRIAKGEIKPNQSDAAFLTEVLTTWDLTGDDDAPLQLNFQVINGLSTGLQLALITAIYDDQRDPQGKPEGH